MLGRQDISAMLARLSFRQLLLAGFVFIALLLSATSLHTLLTLERLAKHSRTVARQAVKLTEDTQRLDERTVAMERSARQYLVLDDTVFRTMFFTAWQEAQTSLKALTLAIPNLPAQQVAEWNTQSELAWKILQESKPSNNNKLSALIKPNKPSTTSTNQQALYQVFIRLPEINNQLALASKREIERRNDLSLADLERQRHLLMSLLVGAMILAILLALSFGMWLSRPLAQIEAVIERLGENKFDKTIDVSGPADLRKLGQQLEWLRLRLADLEADKARFLRHISHELKTPLAALREGVALLEDEVVGTLSHQQRDIARILRQNTASLQTQIEDLLRYNAAAFDAHQLHLSPVNPTYLLHTVIDDQRLQWQSRGLQVDLIEAPGHVGSILADAEKLGISLANLLANAIRFSPLDGTIRFMIDTINNQLCIDCIDQGPGVATSDAARIFDPFYQGIRQASGARSGNGIGLSIVEEYIVAHGGKIRLLQTNTGAHFRIELPYEH